MIVKEDKGQKRLLFGDLKSMPGRLPKERDLTQKSNKRWAIVREKSLMGGWGGVDQENSSKKGQERCEKG